MRGSGLGRRVLEIGFRGSVLWVGFGGEGFGWRVLWGSGLGFGFGLGFSGSGLGGRI